VSAFIAGWEAQDAEAILAHCAVDIVYENVEWGTITGIEQMRAAMSAFVGGWKDIVWAVHNQIESGGIVMNERTDHFITDDRDGAVRVMGVFEVADRKITAWRDYFDTASGRRALGQEA